LSVLLIRTASSVPVGARCNYIEALVIGSISSGPFPVTRPTS
jgi:hypothetical protein